MNKIKSLREQNRYTQAEIAEKAGVSRQAYIKYENGEVEPPLSVIRKLCSFYGVSYEEFIDGVEEDVHKPVTYSAIHKPQEYLKVAEPSGSFEGENLINFDFSKGEKTADLIIENLYMLSLVQLKMIYEKMGEKIREIEKSTRKLTLKELESFANKSDYFINNDVQDYINKGRADRVF